jgi:hypothetical protein
MERHRCSRTSKRKEYECNKYYLQVNRNIPRSFLHLALITLETDNCILVRIRMHHE